MCNNNLFGGNCWCIILVILLLFGCGGFGGCGGGCGGGCDCGGNNNCGCGC